MTTERQLAMLRKQMTQAMMQGDLQRAIQLRKEITSLQQKLVREAHDRFMYDIKLLTSEMPS